VLRDGYQGFQFDYENIHYTYREKFTRFFQRRYAQVAIG
jgi:spore germination protein YaaH